MQTTKKKIFRSAFTLGLGTFLAKLLGAVYRIPLTAILTPAGLGLYQMVFPVYTVLLDFSGAGVPNALSKIIAKETDTLTAKKYLGVALKCLSVLGGVGFLTMAIFCKPFSVAQGNGEAYLGYLFLSPSVFAVSLISCFRGYFQGKMDMRPTAVSQVTEQAVKLVFGLFFAYVFLPSMSLSVAGATLGITLSEAVALVYLVLRYKKSQAKTPLFVKTDKAEFFSMAKKIFYIAVPVTLTGIVLPLSQVADSFLTLNILGAYRSDATTLYGILSGVALTVIHLPVAVCYGISSVTVPAVSGAKTRLDKKKNAVKTLALTFAVSGLATLFVFFFSEIIIKILFPSLSESEFILSCNLLKLCSPIVLFLSLLQTENGVFIGMGKPYIPVISLLSGVVVKTITEVLLMKNPSLNIYGGAIGLIACYFFACLVNLVVLITIKVKYDSKKHRLKVGYN